MDIGAQHAALIESFAVQLKGREAGQPLTLLKWQRDYIERLYGTRLAPGPTDTGRDAAGNVVGARQYRKSVVVKPKKVGKSHFFGLVAILEAITGPYGGDIHIKSSSRDQSEEIFGPIAETIRLSEPLRRDGLFVWEQDVKYSTQTILFRGKNVKIKVLGSAAGSNQGKGPRVLLIDELHVFIDSQQITDVEEGMVMWGDDALSIKISNTGEVGGSPVFWEELDYAEACMEDPDFDPNYLADVTEAPRHMSDDEVLTYGQHWHEINPAIGETVSLAALKQTAKEAQIKPSKRPEVLRLHFCRKAQAAQAAVPMDAWEAASVELDESDLGVGRECYAGIDLAARWDFTAIVLAFPQIDGGMLWWPTFFLPEKAIATIAARTRLPLQTWAEQKHIRLTKGAVTNYGEIEEHCLELHRTHDVRSWGFDPKFAWQLSQNLEAEGLEMVELTQNARTYTEPWGVFEEQLLEERPEGGRKFRHPKHPVLTYCAQSLAVKRSMRDESVMPVRVNRRESSKRIDGMVAGLMATRSLLLGADVAPPSISDLVMG